MEEKSVLPGYLCAYSCDQVLPKLRTTQQRIYERRFRSPDSLMWCLVSMLHSTQTQVPSCKVCRCLGPGAQVMCLTVPRPTCFDLNLDFVQARVPRLSQTMCQTIPSLREHKEKFALILPRKGTAQKLDTAKISALIQIQKQLAHNAEIAVNS